MKIMILNKLIYIECDKKFNLNVKFIYRNKKTLYIYLCIK